DHVARWVADRALPHHAVLVGGFLDHLDVVGLYGGEGGVHVRAGEHQAGERALGDHLGDDLALLLGDVRVGSGRVEHDVDVGLSRWADGQPAHVLIADVLADLEAERVAVEAQCGLSVGVREEAGVNGDVHAAHRRARLPETASRFLTGLVTRRAMHGGIPSAQSACCSRYWLGGIPTSSVNRVLNVPSEEKPTAKHTSVTK